MGQHHIRPYGPRIGCHSSSYAGETRWGNIFGNKVHYWVDFFGIGMLCTAYCLRWPYWKCQSCCFCNWIALRYLKFCYAQWSCWVWSWSEDDHVSLQLAWQLPSVLASLRPYRARLWSVEWKENSEMTIKRMFDLRMSVHLRVKLSRFWSDSQGNSTSQDTCPPNNLSALTLSSHTETFPVTQLLFITWTNGYFSPVFNEESFWSHWNSIIIHPSICDVASHLHLLLLLPLCCFFCRPYNSVSLHPLIIPVHQIHKHHQVTPSPNIPKHLWHQL